MNRYEMRRLKKELEKLIEKNPTFVIKLIDKTYLCEENRLTEIDIIPTNLKVFEIDAEDKEFFYFFSINGEPQYTILTTVSKAKEKGILD